MTIGTITLTDPRGGAAFLPLGGQEHVTWIARRPDGSGEFGTGRIEGSTLIRDTAESLPPCRRPSKGWRRHVRRAKARQ